MIDKDRVERFTVPSDAVWGINFTQEEIDRRARKVRHDLDEAIKRNAKLKEEQNKSK